MHYRNQIILGGKNKAKPPIFAEFALFLMVFIQRNLIIKNNDNFQQPN
jgi:hypothetical protein